MVANFVPAVLIKTVALSCRLRILRRDSGDFDQALETAEERWMLNVQVEQHIVWKIRGFAAEYDRGYAGQLVFSAAVRNKIR